VFALGRWIQYNRQSEILQGVHTRGGAAQFERHAGNPTLRTPAGWLLVYHGVDDALYYRQGVALLDLEDPSRVLSRPEGHVSEPREPWEHPGNVPHVVFSCATLQVG
jgi:predicted GH43/DUF377 family glycosyl hydrolase